VDALEEGAIDNLPDRLMSPGTPETGKGSIVKNKPPESSWVWGFLKGAAGMIVGGALLGAVVYAGYKDGAGAAFTVLGAEAVGCVIVAKLFEDKEKPPSLASGVNRV
jgi:hypothetical protein